MIALLVAVLSMRLLQVQTASAHLQVLIDHRPDVFLAAQLQWGRTEVHLLTRVIIGLVLVLGGVCVLQHKSRD